MIIEPAISSCNIIFVGDFNPRIFTPDWLYIQGIISEHDKDDIEIEVIHSELSKVRCDWFTLEVTKKRFLIETSEAPFIRILDFVANTFGENLVHTPINMIGINRRLHFPMSQDQKDTIGKTLAPQEAWGEWGNAIDGGPEKSNHGGLRLITMEQRNLSDRDNGYIKASVQPSTISGIDGILIDINDHYEVTNSENASESIEVVTSVFEDSISRSEWIADQVLSIGK